MKEEMNTKTEADTEVNMETDTEIKIKKRKQKSLNQLLLKNTIAILIPTLFILLGVLGMLKHYPIVYRMTNHRVEQLEDLNQWYAKKAYNVTVKPLQLKYTGYDYYEDERMTGAYYYSFMEDTCVFFLIQTKNPEPLIENATVRGKMLKDSVPAEAMKNAFSADMGLDYTAFSAFVNPIVISEPDYPYLEIILMWVALILPMVLACTMIVGSIVWSIRPEWHPAVRQLKEIGDCRLVYEEIRSQFKNPQLQHNYNYYVTEDYLIINRWLTTDFIRIDFIRYISKHVIQKWNGRKQVYRLTMSNPEKMFYERDFNSEECADEIMATLIRRNPDIDNRTMKVFRLQETVEPDTAEVTIQEEPKEPTEKDAVQAE